MDFPFPLDVGSRYDTHLRVLFRMPHYLSQFVSGVKNVLYDSPWFAAENKTNRRNPYLDELVGRIFGVFFVFCVFAPFVH